MPKSSNTKRISVDLTPDQVERLERVQHQAALRSKAEVFREALRLYEFFIQQANDGQRVILEREGVQRELVLFARSPVLADSPVSA